MGESGQEIPYVPHPRPDGRTLKETHLYQNRGEPNQSHRVPGYRQGRRNRREIVADDTEDLARKMKRNAPAADWLVKGLHSSDLKNKARVVAAVLQPIALEGMDAPTIVDNWYALNAAMKRNNGQPSANQFLHVMNKLTRGIHDVQLTNASEALDLLNRAAMEYLNGTNLDDLGNSITPELREYIKAARIEITQTI